MQGYKLLAVFLFLELIVRRATNFSAVRFGFAARIWWPLLELSLFTLLACGLVVVFAKVPLSQLGIYSWRHWTETERYYFPQIVAITVVVFCFTATVELKAFWARPDSWRIILFVFVPQMIWGFYQEFLYRGVLQTEFVRRWGTATGMLVSNLIFTFGPLHFYHFAAARNRPSHLWIFAGIFSIGLYFAVLFARSGNLLIIGVLHGLGDWFIDGLAYVAHMPR